MNGVSESQILDTFWDNKAKRRIIPVFQRLALEDTINEVIFAISRPSYEEQAAAWYAKHPDATRSDF